MGLILFVASDLRLCRLWPWSCLQPTTKAAKKWKKDDSLCSVQPIHWKKIPVGLNLKNQKINLIFLPKMRYYCPVIIKTMTLQRLKPARWRNQDNFFFKKKFSCTKIILFFIEHWQPWNNLKEIMLWKLRYKNWSSKYHEVVQEFFYLKHFQIYL